MTLKFPCAIQGSVLPILVGLTVITTLTGCQALPDQTVPSGQRAPRPVAPVKPTAVPDLATAPPQPETVVTRVIRVVDGDTIIVEANVSLPSAGDAEAGHPVQLLGIDTPELKVGKDGPSDCGAQAAADHLSQLLPQGTEVTITYENTPGLARIDDSGRSLAYVSTSTVPDVNRVQIADGYAEVLIPWNRHRARRWVRTARWNDYLSAAALARDSLAGAYGAPEYCTSLGRR